MARDKKQNSDEAPGSIYSVILKSGIPLESAVVKKFQDMGWNYFGQFEYKQKDEEGRIIVRENDGYFRYKVEWSPNSPIAIWLPVECKYNLGGEWIFWQMSNIEPPFHLQVCRDKEFRGKGPHPIERMREAFATPILKDTIYPSGIDLLNRTVCCDATCIIRPKGHNTSSTSKGDYTPNKESVKKAIKQIKFGTNAFYKYIIEKHFDEKLDKKFSGSIIAPIIITNCDLKVITNDMKELEEMQGKKEEDWQIKSQEVGWVLMYLQGGEDLRMNSTTNWEHHLTRSEGFPHSGADREHLSISPNYCWVVNFNSLERFTKYLRSWIGDQIMRFDSETKPK